MYLATFKIGDKEDWGLVRPEVGLICPAKVWVGQNAPATLLDFIRLSADDKKLLSYEPPLPNEQWLAIDEVELIALFLDRFVIYSA